MTASRAIAICPGSYDPVTNGHLDIIGRASRVFDRVDRRRRRPADPQAEDAVHRRGAKGFLVDATAELDNVEVEIFSNLLVEFARENGATAIVKGLRAISDFEYEFEMNQLNRKLAPEHRVGLHLRLARVQLPLLDRRQGDGDVRRRRQRSGPAGGGGGAQGARHERE